MWGVVTLLVRSLRLESFWLRTHLFRMAMAVIIYLMMIGAQIQSQYVGAPGLGFFAQMLVLNLIFITAGGLAFFPTAITEEKEEGTIGLLMMAGIGPLVLLFGKSTSRLLQALLLLAVQFPFTLLAITLGGVLLNQVLAAYATLLAFTVLTANAGLLASVLARRSGTAMAYLFLFLVIYYITPLLVPELQMELGRRGWLTGWFGSGLDTVLSWGAESSAFIQLGNISRTGFNGSPIGTQVLTNLFGAAGCFLLSWALFRRYALNQNSEPVELQRGVLATSTRRWSSAGRAWSNALAWKDYQFLAGGNVIQILKLCGYGALLPIIAYVESTNRNELFWYRLHEYLDVHLSIVLGLGFLEACLMASRMFHDEVRQQTLSSLLTLPRSIPYIAYSKLAGALLGLVPCLTWALINTTWRHQGLAGLIESVTHPSFWTTSLFVIIFLHLVVLLSLFVRWGALPLAFLIAMFSTNCCPVLWFPFMISHSSVVDDMSVRIVLIGVLWLAHGISITVLQTIIHARLYELGAN